MTATHTTGTDRRVLIAEAGMRIIARDGVRALTHRAVDREAGLSQGSSSYYVPTRSALIDLIVRTLAERSIGDAEQFTPPMPQTHAGDGGQGIEALAAGIAQTLEAFAARTVEMRTRYALLLELDAEDPSRALLAQQSPVRQGMLGQASQVLAELGVADPPARARELFELAEALLARRVILGGDAAATEALVRAHLRGLASGHDADPRSPRR